MPNGLTRTLQALADPTRRAILHLLNDGDLAAGEIAAQFAISGPSISHHLRVLREAELIVQRRQGQQLRYRLNATVVQEALAELMQLLRVSSGRREEAGDA